MNELSEHKMKELSEQLQENILTYLDGFPYSILAGISTIIVNTINEVQQ